MLSNAYIFSAPGNCSHGGRKKSPSPPRENETHLLLHRDLDFDPFRMWFGPNEARIDNPDLCKSPQPSQAQRQQLPALKCSRNPVARRLQPPVTATTKVDGGFALDAFGYIDVELNAVVAHSDTGGAIYGRATGRTEDSEEPEVVRFFSRYI